MGAAYLPVSVKDAADYRPIAANALQLAHTHIHFGLGPNKFAATLFGSKHGHNWSTSLMHSAERDEYVARLGRVLRDLNVGQAYTVDATEFNTKILHPRVFGAHKQLAGHCYRQALGQPAEGLSLERGDAAFQSPAGCMTIVMSRYNSYDSRTIDPIKAHAGRWSLVRPRNSERRHESVCHAILERLHVDTPQEARDVWVKILWGIRPGDFPHPLSHSEYADTNNWLRYYIDKCGWGQGTRVRDEVAYFDLASIAKAQLMQRGVPEAHIDLTHAYLPHTDVYKDGGRGKPRNLVVVKRVS